MNISFFRLWGLIVKEFTQFVRDRSTFALVIGLPIVQLILFGLAINTNPKALPTALINFDDGPFSRTLIHELENTQYFKFDHFPKSEAEAKKLMATHQVLFILTIGHKVGIAIMAAHALYLYHPLKAAAGTFLKARSEVPAVLLGIKSYWRLVQVAIYIEDVRIGLLP